MVDEKYLMDKLVITKSLRSGYKNPNQIAHKVLADRIGKRDSGNKPSIGDRIACSVVYPIRVEVFEFVAELMFLRVN